MVRSRSTGGAATATASATAGFPLGGALLILFIALKLTGVIAWSWVWVLAPLWIPFALIAVIFAIAGVLSLIGKALK